MIDRLCRCVTADFGSRRVEESRAELKLILKERADTSFPTHRTSISSLIARYDLKLILGWHTQTLRPERGLETLHWDGLLASYSLPRGANKFDLNQRFRAKRIPARSVEDVRRNKIKETSVEWKFAVRTRH
jgi:hypothetical protein